MRNDKGSSRKGEKDSNKEPPLGDKLEVGDRQEVSFCCCSDE